MTGSTLRRFSCSIFFMGLLGSCATLVPAPKRPTPTASQANAAWGRVLAKHVDREGRVDFQTLARNPGDLETMVAWVGHVSPQNNRDLFKSKEEILAFHLNAYNALAMYGVIEDGIPSDFDGFFKRLRFFFRRKYMLGGERSTLYKYETDVIRPIGEPRVHFALNCMSVGCPRLPQEPYSGDRLEIQLDAGATEFFNKDKYVQIDAVSKVARLSEILKFYTSDFVNDRVSPSLIAYVNRFRQSEKIPDDYKVEFLKYDWTINRQPNGRTS